MKCIRCTTDSKYSERTGGVCPKCQGKFAFEPKSGDKVTDAGFFAAIERVSASGHIRWGVENLYYEVARRRKRAGPTVVVVLFVVALIPSLAALQSAWVLPPWALALGVSLVLQRAARGTIALDEDEFNGMWSKWTSAHGPPVGLIVRADPKAQELRPARAAEPDLGDYSFDRAVICDRARTVDLLLSNNFHFENNCAVLSIRGYPSRAFETVRAMLRRNPRVVVFALHDATWDGCTLAHRLATDPTWFAEIGRVIDVGLRPRHAVAFRGLWRAATGNGSSPAIRRDEARWLSRHALELAAIRPEQIIKRLFRAITAQTALEHQPDEPQLGADDTLLYDATASDGGDDSFG